ncbi:MAG: alpha/beta hydrolase [Phycisphaerales bacterium]
MTLAAINWPALALLLLEGLVFSWAALVLYTGWILTHPPRRSRGWAVARSLPSDPAELTPSRAFEADDRAILAGLRCPVWHVPGDDPAGPVVIVSHGWGESRVHGLARLAALLPSASRVILWDMPGHGDAAGRCHLGRLEPELLRALIDSAVGPPPTGRVVLYGSSLGAGVSIAAAASDARVIGVIAEAPYRLPQTPASNMLRIRGLPNLGSVRAAMTLLGGVAWQHSAGPFDRAAIASRVTAPLLVIHGDLDHVCPPADGAAIAQDAPTGEWMSIPGAAHLNLWTDEQFRPRIAAAVGKFMQRLTPGPAAYAGSSRQT